LHDVYDIFSFRIKSSICNKLLSNLKGLNMTQSVLVLV